MVETIQAAQLREHGGSPGLRDEGLLESALARPQQKFAYADQPDMALLAAAYAFGLAKNHAFVDGNKRTAFIAAYVFLGLNDHELTADEADVVATMESVAAGRIGEAALADWIRAHLDD